jgi:hypothetical protein
LKIRTDYVTNSSSSSFVISRKHVTLDKLRDICVEIAKVESEYWDDDPEEIKSYDDIAYRYVIHGATIETPCEDYDGYTYHDNFIVENDDCGRYYWWAIDDVLEKHGIPWHHGYCD